MNKKGETSESNLLEGNFIYIILALIFFSIMVYFVVSKSESATVVGDYYAKEIAKIMNLAKPGDEITIDVHYATSIAKKNNLYDFQNMFSFDNAKNKVCVKISYGRETCYSYFNQVDVLEKPVFKLEGETTTISFKISEKAR